MSDARIAATSSTAAAPIVGRPWIRFAVGADTALGELESRSEGAGSVAREPGHRVDDDGIDCLLALPAGREIETLGAFAVSICRHRRYSSARLVAVRLAASSTVFTP